MTRADKRRGRGGELTPSPVKAAAIELGLPVSHDGRRRDRSRRADGAELGVVVAFGQIIKPHVLAVLPFVNLHFSLLPRWRGAAPVERALLAGDDVTGVCVMRLEEGLDTGGVYASRTVPIGETTTAAELRETLVEVGSELLVDTLEPAARRVDRRTPTTAGRADVRRQVRPRPTSRSTGPLPVVDIHRLIRVGGAWTTFRSKRLKINAADLVDGRIVPTDGPTGGQGGDVVRRLAQRRPPVADRTVRRPVSSSSRERPPGGARRAAADRGRRRLRQPRARPCAARTRGSASSIASS